MAFTLLACSDIRAQKVNLELPFINRPRSLEVVQQIIEQTFREEEVAIKRELHATDTRKCEPFTLTRLQRYDDDTHTWNDITSAEDLLPYDQLYVYRKNSTCADISTQRELPAPRLSTYFARIRDEVENTTSTATVHSMGRHSNYNRNKYNREGGGRSRSRSTSSSKREQYTSQLGAGTPKNANIISGNNYEGKINNNNYTSNHSSNANKSATRNLRDNEKKMSTMHSERDLISTSPSKRTTTSPTTRSTATYFFAHDASTPEQINFLFQLADVSHTSQIAFTQFANLFKSSYVHFPSDVLQDVFDHFANNFTHANIRVMTNTDFSNYASHFPITVSVLYQHLANQERISVLQDAQQETERSVTTLTKQIEELRLQLYNSERELERATSRRERVTEELNELMREQNVTNANNEQAVCDKEISVFRYRERLAQEEKDYERLATERRRNLHNNSPSSVHTNLLRHTKHDYRNKYGPPPSSLSPTSSLY